jgi:hypothetical protein
MQQRRRKAASHRIFLPSLVRERLNLWRSLGELVKNMSDLLGDPGTAAVTAKFVLETGLVTDFRGFSLQEPASLYNGDLGECTPVMVGPSGIPPPIGRETVV